MKDLNTYLKSTTLSSRFACELGIEGGFINFRNSGARGGVKEFTVSLSSLLAGLNDIKSNLVHFSELTSYVEKEWRDAGSRYFQDLVLNSMITVQTKPCFTTLSKIISWANEEHEADFNDNNIDLSLKSIELAIERIEMLIKQYTPSQNLSSLNVVNKEPQKTQSIRDFAYQVLSTLLRENLSEIESIISKKEQTNKVSLPFLPNVFLLSESERDAKTLSTGEASTLRFFTKPIYFGSEFMYISTQWYGDERRGLSFGNLKLFLEKHFPMYQVDKKDNEYIFSISQAPLHTSELSKPFLILAGISGTGKTRFVRKQVEENSGSLNENYCLTPVRPDWHEPSDLLGYVSRLGEKVHYVTTDVLMFIAKAWRAMVDANLNIQQEELLGKGKHLTVTGERDTLNKMLPYWLCLDEMNLAPVEQYFADYLSVIETREWKWQGEGFTYTCDPILKPATIKQVDEKDLREALGFTGDKYDAVWEQICQHGMSIPLNLIVAGTVNMDETTHGFSRKVIDRALTIDFGEFFPNNIEEFFESKTQAKLLGFPTLSHAKLEHFKSVEADTDASKTKHFFQSINKVLLGTPFELAYRAFNELSLSVVSVSPKNDIELTAVFDDFMMCKVLPRIEGDEDKLLDKEQNNLLEQLIEVIKSQFESILLEQQRPDLFRELIGTPEESINVPCRSLKKLQAMSRTLDNGFTSFWP